MREKSVNLWRVYCVVIMWFMVIHASTFMLWPIKIKIVLYAAALILVVSLYVTNSKHRLLKIDFFMLLLYAYFFYCAVNLSVLYDGLPRFVLGVYEYIFYPMLLFCCLEGLRYTNFMDVRKCLCVIALIASIMAVYEYSFEMYFVPAEDLDPNVIWDEASEDAVTRARVFSSSPMFLGTLLAVYSLAPLERFVSTNDRRYLALYIIVLGGIVAAYSRGPMVAWLCGTLCFFIVYKRKALLRPKMFVGCILVMVVFCIVVFLFGGSFIDGVLYRIFSILEWEDDLSNVGRMLAWINAIDIITDNEYNFILGIGLANTGAKTLWGATSINFVTESGVLKRFVEGGFLMMLLHYSMVFLLLKKALKICKYYILEGAYLIGGLVVILTEDCVLQVTEDVSISFFFWLFAARIIMLERGIDSRFGCSYWQN